MTIQEAVEKCKGYQNDKLKVVFNIYDETPGTIPGLLLRTCDFDNLVVHMFDLDIHNYSVNEILKCEQRHNMLEGYHQPILIGVKNCTKERRPKR
jgi:hypothetical protein